jgi:uncharacterized protein
MTRQLEFAAKPIIGMVQPPALPGSAGWRGRSFADTLEFSLTDARNLIDGGADAVLVQNMWDGPGGGVAGPETVSQMTRIVAEIGRLGDFPLGVTLGANDGGATIAVAAGSGATFVRLKVFVGTMLKSEGLVSGCAAAALSMRRRLGRDDITILADVHDRSGTPLGGASIADDADGARWSSADGLLITGRSTDESLELLRAVRIAVPDFPILTAGGTRVDNVGAYLPLVDGIIVGATLKRNGSDPEPVDVDRVRQYMAAVRGAAVR